MMMMNNSTSSLTEELQPAEYTNNYSICYSTPQEFSLDEFEIEFVIHGLLISCVGLFGLCGNMASIFIFSKPQMRNSINTILIALVSCDLLVILTSILMFSLTVFGNTGLGLFESYVTNIYPYAAGFVYPVAMIAQTCSAYLTMAVTIERYIAVCWPLKARFLCTIGRAKMAVGAVVSFAVIYNIPRFLEITWRQEYDHIADENCTSYAPTQMRMNATYISIYVTWMYLVFMYIIPFTTLACFNLKTWLEMRKASARRAQLSTQEQKEHNLATMLLVVVLVFFICNLLPLVVNILELFFITYNLMIQFSNLLVTINSSVNILIYCTFGKKFRTVFLQIFFGKQPPCVVVSSTSVTRHTRVHTGNNETLPLASLKSSPPTSISGVSRKYSYNLQNDQNQSVRITIMEKCSTSPTPSQKSIVKMVRISPNHQEDHSSSETLLDNSSNSAPKNETPISKVNGNECNGYSRSVIRPSDLLRSTAC